ncbi:hypothetical protein D3C80_1370750 [compost metagenome]
MGCQVDTKHNSISYSAGARLVVEMCSLWYEADRDSDGTSTQVKIDSSSARAAHDEVPKTYQEYLVWRCVKGLGRWYNERRIFDEQDFTTARQFVEQTARQNVDIWVSQ